MPVYHTGGEPAGHLTAPQPCRAQLQPDHKAPATQGGVACPRTKETLGAAPLAQLAPLHANMSQATAHCRLPQLPQQWHAMILP